MKRQACYRAVYALSSKYKIAAMCLILGVSYYKRLNNRVDKDEMYGALIQEITAKDKAEPTATGAHRLPC